MDRSRSFCVLQRQIKRRSCGVSFWWRVAIVLKKTFTIDRLIQVKDIFIFCCFTGLSYADVKKINVDSIVCGCDGKKWLLLKRTKTGTPMNVPLLPPALELLGKYENHSFCLHHNKLLPVLSNQKMNSYLKEIADICGIHKNLTFHTARHTFATTVTLNNDVPIESVSKMLGHKSIYTTQHYATTQDKKISSDMHSIHAKYGAMWKSLEFGMDSMTVNSTIRNAVDFTFIVNTNIMIDQQFRKILMKRQQ